MDPTAHIVQFLREKYSPKAIVLAGSRAQGTSHEESDWDLFLYCEKDATGGFFELDGSLLDLTVRTWPLADDAILTIPYGPLFPVKVLFDDTNGVLEKMLERTEKAFHSGPLTLYPEGCAERLQKLNRWRGKLQRYAVDPEVQFYYAGFAYEFFVRVWFEQQNLWPLAPAPALSAIKQEDPAFWNLLRNFTAESGQERVETANTILKKLQAFHR